MSTVARLSLLTLLFFLLASVHGQQGVTTVSPKRGAVVADTLITLVWNVPHPPTGNVTFQVQSASDSLFTAVVHDQQGLLSGSTTLTFSMGQTYWWRVREYQGTTPQGWSVISSFSTFSPALLPGVVVWLETDSGIQLINGFAESWHSMVGTYVAGQSDSLRRPMVTDTVLFQRQALVFDGTNDFLQGPFLNHSGLSMIMLHNPLNKNSSLFTQARFSFTGFNWFINSSSKPSLNCLQTPSNLSFTFNGVTYPFTIPSQNLSIDGMTLDNSGPTLFTGMADADSAQTITFLDNPALTFSRIGAMGNNSSYYKGNVYALIVTGSILSKTDYQKVFDYLSWKYQPPVNLGSDKNLDYQLCAQPLEPDHHYRSYLWSTGATTRSITAHQAGTYWLQATDFFGRTTADTILVTGQRPQVSLSDTVICLGDTINLHTGITGNYMYIWNHNSQLSNSTLPVSVQGKVHVEVTDTLGCSVTDSAMVLIDVYPVLISLGPDRSSCIGNPLSLTSGSSQSVTYQWSTGANDTLPYIIITSAGAYGVTTTNNRGCVASSQVNISLAGISPTAQIQLSSQQVCLGDTIWFSDNSISDPQDPINVWNWQMGDNSSFATQGPFYHVYASTGFFQVSLTITTDSGCVNTQHQQLQIMPLPTVNITPKKGCSGQTVTFGYSVPGGTTPAAYLWEFHSPAVPPHQDTAANPQFMWATQGSYVVSLKVTNNQGCIRTDTFHVTIHPSPAPLISASKNPSCPGTAVFFTESGTFSPAFPNQYWFWNFGDGTPAAGTTVNTSNHVYNTPGAYQVKLLTGSLLSGCSDSTTLLVQVNHLPVAKITDAELCTGEVKALSETSTATGDSIVSWIWWIEGFGIVTTRNPSVSYSDTGQYQMKLTVETGTGCKDSTMGIITVHPNPIALFSMNPFYGLSPLTVNFFNHSQIADQYLWQFGDGTTSTVAEPSHTYQTEGLFEVTLTAQTFAGCSNTYTAKVFASSQIADVEVTSVEGERKGDIITTVVDVRNNSPFELHQLELRAWLSGGSPVLETWQSQPGMERLLPGKTIRIPLASGFITTDDLPDIGDIVCVHVLIPEFPVDKNPDNNRKCTPLTRDFTLKDPWPNPAHTHINFDIVIDFPDKVEIEVFTIHGVSLGIFAFQYLEEGLNRITLPVTPAMRNGVYIFTLRYRSHVINKKVIIRI
jgi:PKD repeat protein